MPYQDKQLKKEFIQVNGRTVPFGYPQFWNEDKDDWDISSKNNPLPTGDYGMTEGGVWIPKKVSDDGTTLTQLIGSNVAVKDVNADNLSAVIPSAGSHTIEVAPPEGVIWRTPLIWVLMRASSGATTGNNMIELKHGIDNYRYLVLRARSKHNNMARIMANVAETATDSSLPEDKITQQNAIQSLILSKDKPLFVTFTNTTDVENNGGLEIRMIITEERVTQ